MNTQKIGLVYSSRPPQWVSCVSILSGLLRAYQEFFPSHQLVHYNLERKSTPYDATLLANKIITDQVNTLVFIDHSPHPLDLVKSILKKKATNHEISFYFHLYGDFTYYASSWEELGELLTGHRTKLICASKAQQALIGNFFATGQHQTDYCPFPINHDLFNFNPKRRTTWRQKLNTANEEYLFVYTGRLSVQKNIIPMCQEFIQFAEKAPVKCRLLLAGSFDDIGVPFLKIATYFGHYYQTWSSFIDSLNPSQLQYIKYLGEMAQEELVGLYHAADCYLGLGLYHDEDYGMAPLEALCCGSSAILTAWGGFSSFAADTICQLVDVSIEKNGLIINSQQLHNLLHGNVMQKRTEQERAQSSKLFINNFSVHAMSKYLPQIHSSKPDIFPGFNWKLGQIKNYIYDYPIKDSFYEEIYGKYINQKRESFSSN